MTPNFDSAKDTTGANQSVPNERAANEQLEQILKRIPALIRAPRPGDRCPYTGKSRTSFLELVAPCERNGFRPPVRAIYQRAHKYAQRGVWLVPADNLFRHLLSLQESSVEAYLETTKARKAAHGR